jgi:hypothetical protein
VVLHSNAAATPPARKCFCRAASWGKRHSGLPHQPGGWFCRLRRLSYPWSPLHKCWEASPSAMKPSFPLPGPLRFRGLRGPAFECDCIPKPFQR